MKSTMKGEKMKFLEKVEQLQRENEGYIVFVVNGKIICRKMAKKNVVFPTYFLCHESMI